MDDKIFEELLESVKEGGAILRGEKAPVRTFSSAAVDVREIRQRLGLSQRQFAVLLGISVRTLQNWEQGRRRPRGAAWMLLQIAARHPDVVLDVARDVSMVP